HGAFTGGRAAGLTGGDELARARAARRRRAVTIWAGSSVARLADGAVDNAVAAEGGQGDGDEMAVAALRSRGNARISAGVASLRNACRVAEADRRLGGAADG